MKLFSRFSQVSDDEHLVYLSQQEVNFNVNQPIHPANWHQYDTRLLMGMDTEDNSIWEKACHILATYQFVPPEIMQVYFDENLPLSERNLALNSRFLFLKFRWAGRIARVIDEICETDAGSAQVFGCSYQTLESHFEQGELTTEIWRYTATNEVYFRMHAYSRVGQISNPIYRWTFPIALRFMRPYFVWRSLRRMKKLVK